MRDPLDRGSSSAAAGATAVARRSLFERLGGRPVLERVHRLFYDRIYAHPWLKQYFAAIDQKHIEKQQTDFMSFAMGGPALYGGRLVPKAHEHVMITTEMIELRTAMLKASLDEAAVPPELQQEWLRIDGAFEKVLTKGSLAECQPRYDGDAILDFPRPPFA
ncbi:MAG: group 1 truncated hemoglobin [Planctomycetes bacterium]|nr:group 1 truncated hemoglobin [Planctomycetota bacterium]